MKKIISLIIVAVMTACVFTSCDYVSDIIGGLGGEKNTEATITADQWENIDSVTNFTMNFLVETTNVHGAQSIFKTYKITDTALHFKVTQRDASNTSIDDTYNIIDNGQKYTLTQFNRELSQWEKVWHAYKYDWKQMSMIDAMGFGLDISYDDLTYDKEKGAYVYTLSEADLIGIISYYFEKGILVKVTANTYKGVSLSDINENTPCEEKITVAFSNIGTTEVRIPTYTVEPTS